MKYNKFKEIREYLRLSQTEMAEKVGLLQSDISQLEIGKKKFIPTNLIDFLIKENFDINALFDDNSIMVFRYKNTINEPPLIKKLNPQLNPHSKINEPPLNLVRDPGIPKYSEKTSQTWSAPKIITVNSEGTEAAVMIDIKAAAGLPCNIDNPQYYSSLPTMMLPRNQFGSGTYICIQARGDSMQPTILHQDWLISRFEDNPIKNIKDNHVYVVVSKEGVIVKRLLNQMKVKGILVCQSDNLIGNDPFIIEANEILQIYKVEARLSLNLNNLNATITQRLSNIEYELLELRKMVKK